MKTLQKTAASLELGSSELASSYLAGMATNQSEYWMLLGLLKHTFLLTCILTKY